MRLHLLLVLHENQLMTNFNEITSLFFCFIISFISGMVDYDAYTNENHKYNIVCMYLSNILILLLVYQLLESALARLLEGRDVSGNTSLLDKNPEICAKFWSQLQTLLKSMLSTARSTKVNKHPVNPNQAPASKSGDAKKLSELYKMSLKSTDFSQLHKMHSLWIA